MSRPILPSDPKPGDVLLLDSAWAHRQPLDSSWRLANDAINLGERLLVPNPRVVHAAFVAGRNGLVMEEAWNGEDRGYEPIDDRWVIVRPRYESQAQLDAIQADIAAELGTPYNYSELAVLGIERLTGIPLPVALHSFICSVIIAAKMRGRGLDFWPGLRTEEIAPCDYLDKAGLPIVGQGGLWLLGAGA